MSRIALMIKGYYERKLWTLSRVDVALEFNIITQSEYDEIVNSSIE